MTEVVKKPWGTYENLLDSTECKVKRIVVKPEQRPSYQYHFKRSEVWVVVGGSGIVTIEGEDMSVSAGSTITVPIRAKHRIKNTGTEDLVFIEVQLGTYFGEDDIVRVEDDYER